MKTIRLVFLRRGVVMLGAILLASTLNWAPVRADDLNAPINPNGPTPNAGVPPGHRAAGAFTARRPGNLPRYGPRPHSYTGVTPETP